MAFLRYTDPSVGAQVATDVVSGNNYQLMKVDVGALGVSTPWTGAVTVTSGNVGITGTVSSTQSGTWNIGTVASITAPVSISGTVPVSIAAVVSANQSQVNGIAVNTGTGQVATGTQRFALGVGTPSVTITNSSIATGGTAQVAIAANAARLALTIQNTHATATLFVNEGGTASATAGLLLNPGIGYEWPIGSMAVGAVSIFSTTTGATYSVRSA